MKKHSESDLRKTPGNHDSDLLDELERQSVSEIRKLRAYERVEIRAEVCIQPGNSSQLGEQPILATTRDVSAGGCLVHAPSPIGVGDVFRLQFDQTLMDLPLVFARCIRCHLLREDSFEAAFSFFSPIELGTSVKKSSGDLLA